MVRPRVLLIIRVEGAARSTAFEVGSGSTISDLHEVWHQRLDCISVHGVGVTVREVLKCDAPVRVPDGGIVLDEAVVEEFGRQVTFGRHWLVITHLCEHNSADHSRRVHPGPAASRYRSQ